jgi:hypothetical protein
MDKVEVRAAECSGCNFQKGGKYALPVQYIGRCHNNAGFSRWCVGMPVALHLLLFSGCSERRGQCISIQKREAGAPEVNAVYQWDMDATEEFLALSFIIVVSGALAMGFGAIKIGIYKDLCSIKFLHEIAFLIKSPSLPYVSIWSIYHQKSTLRYINTITKNLLWWSRMTYNATINILRYGRGED